MTQKHLNDWLKKLKEAWETKNPQKAANLCAEKLLWYETPFEKPLETKNEVLKEWQTVLDQKNISVSYKILAVHESLCITHWKAEFERISNGSKVSLDGIWQINLDLDGKCIEFKQWYEAKNS